MNPLWNAPSGGGSALDKSCGSTAACSPPLSIRGNRYAAGLISQLPVRAENGVTSPKCDATHPSGNRNTCLPSKAYSEFIWAYLWECREVPTTKLFLIPQLSCALNCIAKPPTTPN